MSVLKGVRGVEMAGIGPGPFCAMLLADMGADVVRIDQFDEVDRGVYFPPELDLLNRNKRSVVVDLKSEQGLATAKELIARSDILIEGFRPGVMEKLGLGPDPCLSLNPGLVYGRMTGWGQDGPLSNVVGHDVNFIALTGGSDAIGRQGHGPTIPLNLVGDFGGGLLYLAMGVLAALLEPRASGIRQIVDAAIVDGVANLMTMQFAMRQLGGGKGERGTNIIDSGSPFYNVYQTKDDLYISVGAVEKRFYGVLLDLVGLKDVLLPDQYDSQNWGLLHDKFAEVFRLRTKDEWCQILEGTECCFAPVLSMDEAPEHAHNRHREIFLDVDGVLNPAPVPRFSKIPSALRKATSSANTVAVFRDWQIPASVVDNLLPSSAT